MTQPAIKTRFTRGRVQELKNGHNSITVQNQTHVYMNFFHHKDLGNHLLQLCPKVVKHPVYGGIGIAPLMLPLALEKISGQLHAPTALSPVKKPTSTH